MDSVYLLTNNCLPGIIKIGSDARPKRDCTEINKGAGVFGKWNVRHTWKVEHAVVKERQACKAIFQYKHRLSGGTQIFKIDADKAIILISIGIAAPLPINYQRKLSSIKFNTPVCGYSDTALSERKDKPL